MEDPITCAGELKELALTLELEVEPLAALQLEQALEMIRNSFTAGDFGASSRAEAVRRVANQHAMLGGCHGGKRARGLSHA